MAQATRSSKSSLIIVLIWFAAKFGKIFKLLKAVKIFKFLFSMISMVISAFLYGLAFSSWWFGIGLVVLLFVHEMGHVLAMKMKGMETKWPVFIPFLGAAIFVPGFQSKVTEAFIGYGGPLIGSVGAFVCLLIWYLTGQDSVLWILLAYLGLFLNLFNLIPARPLDGGRILHLLGHWVGYVGVTMIFGIFLLTRDIFFLFLVFMTLADVKVSRWFKLITLVISDIVLAVIIFGITSVQFTKLLEMPWWVWILLPIGLLFFSVVFLRSHFVVLFEFFGRRDLLQEEERKEIVPLKQKILWLGLYLVLLVVLGGSMVGIIEFLPQQVQEGSSLLNLFPE